jgi:hypothetical protein
MTGQSVPLAATSCEPSRAWRWSASVHLRGEGKLAWNEADRQPEEDGKPQASDEAWSDQTRIGFN